MRRSARIGLNIVLALILAAGVIALLCQQARWKNSAAAQDKAIQTARFDPEFPLLTDSGDSEALASLDLAALREVNPDVVGWIYIPDTVISYPILQGPDNDYYLKHTWEKKWNGGGSIFLDWRCSRDFEDFNTLVYGHQMNNDTMFGSLHDYRDEDFWREHPSVYVALEDGVYRYNIFAAWEPSVTSMVYTANFASPEDRQKFMDLCLEASLIHTGVIPGPDDKVLTLSTCTGYNNNARWVVQAKLTEEET